MHAIQNHISIYTHAAREELLVSLGIGQGWIISTGNAMALSELNLKYFTPLRVCANADYHALAQWITNKFTYHALFMIDTSVVNISVATSSLSR